MAVTQPPKQIYKYIPIGPIYHSASMESAKLRKNNYCGAILGDKCTGKLIKSASSWHTFPEVCK